MNPSPSPAAEAGWCCWQDYVPRQGRRAAFSPAGSAIPCSGQWWHQEDFPISGVCMIQRWGCADLVGSISPGRVGTSKGARATAHYWFLSEIKSLLANPAPSSNFQKAAVQGASEKGKKKISTSTTTHQCPSCCPVHWFTISQKSILGFIPVLATGDIKITLLATEPCLNQRQPGECKEQNPLAFL